MGSINFPPDFVDVYLSYLKNLLEAGYKEKMPIYEFSSLYFESKVYERQEKENKLKSQRFASADDFTSSDQFEILLPEFSYESLLILPAVPSSFDTPSTEALSDPIIQKRNNAKPSKNIQDSTKITRVRYPLTKNKLAVTIQQKLDSEKVLERITEFSHLLPDYLRTISRYLEFFDRGEPSEALHTLSRKVYYSTVQYECKSKEDSSKESVNESQITDEPRDVLKKRDVSCQSESEDTEIYTDKESGEVKTFETVETQTIVIGSLPCKHYYELSERDDNFAENPILKEKLPAVVEPREKTPSNSNTCFKLSLKAILMKIKKSKSGPGNREDIIDIRKIPPSCPVENQHLSEELIRSSNKLAAVSEGGSGDSATIEKGAPLLQCAHQSTIKLRLKILSSSKPMNAKLTGARVPEGNTIYNKGRKRDVSVSINGRSWLRTYLTVRMIKKFENENSSWKLYSKDQFEDLGTPVLMPHTYKTERKYNFLFYNLLPYNFLSSIRVWYFARKLREYENIENL